LTIRSFCIGLLLMLSTVALAQQGVVREIIITGNQEVTRDAILAQMRTRIGQPYSRAQLDQDQRTLEDMGFFRAVDVRARPTEEDNWQVTVDVVEWPVVKEVRIVGNTAVPDQDILNVLEIPVGRIYNLRDVGPTARAIERLYVDRGYIARVEDIGPLEESPNTINISIIELVVNTVTVEGNTRTQDRVMRRLIRTEPGEPFNVRTWQADLRRIHGTQWFERIDVVEREPEQIGRIDLVLRVQEARTGIFNVGLQVDPRSNFAAVFSMADTNFRGTGQSVGVSFLQGTTGEGASVDLSYGNPWFFGDTSLNVNVYSRLLFRFAGTGFGGDFTPTEGDRYTERRTGTTIAMSRQIGDYVFTGLSLRAENINTSNVATGTQNAFIQQDGDVAILGGNIIVNRRDVDIDPSRGDWSRLSFEPGYANIRRVGGAVTGDTVLGASTFFRGTAEYRRYFSPGPPRGTELDAPRRVLALRMRYGGIVGQVPFFEQFFAGGADSIRGYPEDRFWGRQTFITNVEYRHPIQRAFNIVAFLDYGGAWGGYGGVGQFTQAGTPQFNLGYGVGFSFRSPLGPIRLDFGFNERGGSRTHFLIGTAF
jgi:outer membrane protein insertion porin family